MFCLKYYILVHFKSRSLLSKEKKIKIGKKTSCVQWGHTNDEDQGAGQILIPTSCHSFIASCHCQQVKLNKQSQR